jgi:hypothetical protein
MGFLAVLSLVPAWELHVYQSGDDNGAHWHALYSTIISGLSATLVSSFYVHLAVFKLMPELGSVVVRPYDRSHLKLLVFISAH